MSEEPQSRKDIIEAEILYDDETPVGSFDTHHVKPNDSTGEADEERNSNRSRSEQDVTLKQNLDRIAYIPNIRLNKRGNPRMCSTRIGFSLLDI